MKKGKQLIIPLFGLFFIGLFVPNELFKSISYLGPAVFFLLFTNSTDFSLKNLLTANYIWIALFFAFHLVGLTYSDNQNEAVRLIVLRLPLLLVPPFLYYSRYLNGYARRKIELCYACICILAGSIGLIYRLYYISFIDPDINWLYNDNLVSIFGLQAVYYGIYLIIASLFLTNALLDPRQKKKVWLVIGMLLTSIYMLLLASRTSLILYFLMNSALVVFHSMKKNKRIIPVFIGAVIVLLIGMFIFFPNAVKRFKSITDTEYSFNESTDYYHFGEELDANKWNGLNSRLALWSAASRTIDDHLLFGHGTGDKQDKLRETYSRLSFNLALERNFGTHNQYLEVLLMFGLVGLSFFLVSLLAPLYYFLKKGYLLNVLILITFIIAFTTEDFLGRNQGVAIFAFFYAFFASGKTAVKNFTT